MTALVYVNQGKNRHIPYRDSKLTFLLRVNFDFEIELNIYSIRKISLGFSRWQRSNMHYSKYTSKF